MKIYSFLKKTFIPHRGNSYKPHFFREFSIKILLITSIFLLGFSAGSSFFIHKTVLGTSVVSSVLIDLTNENRLAFNEDPLIRNDKLNEAAKMKGQDMAKFGYFAHNSPKGVTPWHWFTKVGYTFLYAGENLAINFTDSNDVENAWLNSPAHRANLLNVDFKEIGIATISGTYQGNSTIFVVQMFGTPLNASALESTSDKIDTATATPKIVVKATTTLSTATTTLLFANPEVKGTTTESLQPIITTSELAVVKNLTNGEVTSVKKTAVTYSKWYERLLFGGSRYVTFAYEFLIAFVTVALLMMLFIEIKRQHWRHISYGVLMIVIMIAFVYINNIFF